MEDVQLRRPRGGVIARGRIAAALVCLGAGVAVAALAAGAFAGKAGALASQVAMENINTSTVGLAYDPSSVPDPNWTTLGKLPLNAGASYVVLATIGLRVAATDTAPIAAECALGATNEPFDTEQADLNVTKGSQVTNISLEGLSDEVANMGAPEAGSATISCHEIGNPGTPNGLVVAHDARIIAIPVDGVTSNLGTYGCLGDRAAAGAC